MEHPICTRHSHFRMKMTEQSPDFYIFILAVLAHTDEWHCTVRLDEGQVRGIQLNHHGRQCLVQLHVDLWSAALNGGVQISPRDVHYLYRSALGCGDGCDDEHRGGRNCRGGEVFVQLFVLLVATCHESCRRFRLRCISLMRTWRNELWLRSQWRSGPAGRPGGRRVCPASGPARPRSRFVLLHHGSEWRHSRTF